MATIASLNIIFRGITGPLQQSVSAAKKTLNGLRSSVMSLSGAFTSLGLGLTFGSIVKASGDAERETRKLEAVLKATGNTAGFTSEELKSYAADLQKLTVFEDDATVGAMAVLATFKKVNGPIFKEAVQSAMDLSTIMGQDLQSSIVQVGKALQDPIRGITALRKAGVSFDENQQQAIKTAVANNNILKAQKIILGELRSEFGGAAAADAQTMAGAITQMRNAWGDLAETIGGKLSPALTQLAKDFQTVVTPPGKQSSVTKSAATDLNDVTKLGERRAELLKKQAELIDKVNANAQQAQGFSIFGAGAAINTIEIESLAADLKTIDRELLRISEKMASNRKFLAEQKTEAPEFFKQMDAAITAMPNSFLGVFKGAKDRFDEAWKRAPAAIAEMVAKGKELNRIMDQYNDQVKAAESSVKDSLMTPIDDFNKRLGEIDLALNANKITPQQAKSAEFLALQQLQSTLPDMNRRAGAIEFGTREAFSAQNSQPKETTQKEILKAAQQQVDLLNRAVTVWEDSGEVVMSIP